METPKLYAVPYNHGTLLYRDEQCERFYANDPWHRHRTNKRVVYNCCVYDLIILRGIKKDPVQELLKFRKQENGY